MLGDSLTAGYGLRPEEALPSRLQSELARLGTDSIIVNAGVSGDTTADGLRRAHQDVPANTELCLVALGANDMMQFVAIDTIRQNLGSILDGLSARKIPAMLCGMRAPPWFGRYAAAFDGLFGEVARERKLPFDSFLKAWRLIRRSRSLTGSIPTPWAFKSPRGDWLRTWWSCSTGSRRPPGDLSAEPVSPEG